MECHVHFPNYRLLRVMRSVPVHRFVIGLFKKHTHHVMPIPSCAVHAPEIDCVPTLFLNILNAGSILPYDKASNSGHALFTVQRETRLVHDGMLSRLTTNRPNSFRSDDGPAISRFSTHRQIFFAVKTVQMVDEVQVESSRRLLRGSEIGGSACTATVKCGARVCYGNGNADGYV